MIIYYDESEKKSVKHLKELVEWLRGITLIFFPKTRLYATTIILKIIIYTSTRTICVCIIIYYIVKYDFPRDPAALHYITRD